MSQDPPKPNYPVSVDRPDLKTSDGHTVGVDHDSGSSYVDTTTGEKIINDSDVHTRFVGHDSNDYSGGGGGGDDGDMLDHIVDAVSDNCTLM